jgi:hypothetical protein
LSPALCSILVFLKSETHAHFFRLIFFCGIQYPIIRSGSDPITPYRAFLLGFAFFLNFHLLFSRLQLPSVCPIFETRPAVPLSLVPSVAVSVRSAPQSDATRPAGKPGSDEISSVFLPSQNL